VRISRSAVTATRNSVAQRRHRLHLAVDVNELAFVGRVNPRGLDGDNQTPALGQRPFGLHRPAFVPKQQNAGADEQNEPEQHGRKRLTNAREPRCVGSFGKAIADARHRPLLLLIPWR
jgi:hypothetical protein